MKIHVAYDSEGHIAAAVLQSPGAGKPTLWLDSKPGFELAQLDVPTQFHGKRLNEFLHLLSVDVEHKRLVERSKR